MQEIVIAKDLYFWVPYDVLEMYFELKNWGVPNLYNFSYEHDEDNKLIQVPFRIDAKSYLPEIDITKVDLGDRPTSDDVYNNLFDVREIDRTDPDLVMAVKCSKSGILKVVEIPDGVKWYIEQEEGSWESIHEVHRSWS